MECLEKMCYQINDLMQDALKWKKIGAHAETEMEKSMAKEISENLHNMYKKSNEYLMKKYAE